MKVRDAFRGIAAVALVSLLAATFGSSGLAQATDDGPPRMDLRWPGHSMQKGARGSSCWTNASGEALCVDVVSGFPRAMWVRSGTKLKVRIHYPEKPEDFSVGAWRRLDENGYPQGRAQRIDVRFEPVRNNGKTRAWDAFFRLDGTRHYYIDAFGAWDRGDASWSFHVRTVKSG